MNTDYEIVQGDCVETMRGMSAGSVDAIVTDGPYGLSFMGKGWDHAVPGVEYWAEALRVAKPGAHILAFGGTRLYHRLTCAIEDAGWEVRDCLSWLYGSGFPKSHNVSKAIDKAAGVEYEKGEPFNVVGGMSVTNAGSKFRSDHPDYEKPTGKTPDAKRWSGWGTSLKPAWEPIILARKPLAGTVAANVCEHGTGAINVDGCRVGTETITQVQATVEGGKAIGGKAVGVKQVASGVKTTTTGRWPANLILDAEAGAAVDEQSGANSSRFFYCPKASNADRGEGNNHPTVKPTDLMRYLCRLITPPGGTVLDPFMGSGSTGKAATLEGFNFIGCELDENYCNIAKERIEHARASAGIFTATA